MPQFIDQPEAIRMLLLLERWRPAVKKTVSILVGDTDAGLLRLLKRALPASSYTLLHIPSGGLVERITVQSPDLVFLSSDDLDTCAAIRRRWQHLPIVILESEADEQVAVRALNQGADDYIGAPFGMDELAARVRALLRRTQENNIEGEEPEVVQSSDGYLSLNTVSRQVLVGGQAVRLTPTEFELLRQLMLHAGKVLTHRDLLRRVWGPEYGDEDDYVRVYIRQLRCKVEAEPAHPRYIQTEPGVGYVFRSPP
jgi:two-component system KDP operon response regulator KdpE